MIRINYEGRFGNQLFQYAHAIADSLESGEGIENPLSTRIVRYNNKTDDQPRRIQLGYCQSPETTQKLLAIRSKIIPDTEEMEGVFVHLRLGDISYRSNTIPSMDYYKSALGQSDFSSGFISSDSPEHPFVQQLIEEFGLTPFCAGEEETILFASQFKNKVLSLGTFSWWIGFLGSQNNVIHPRWSNYDIWHGDIFCVENWRELSIK